MNKVTALASITALTLLASAQSAQAGIYKEVNGTDYGFYFVPPGAPVGSQELGAPSGFGGKWDKYGRTLATANVTDFTYPSPIAAGGDPLTQIQGGLWSDGDVDLFKFKITDPNTFSAYVTSSTAVLTLLASDGTVLGAARGGAANILSDANLAASLTAGDYYIAVGLASGGPAVARNAASQNLFDFSTNGVKDPVTGLSDYKLATDPYVAWFTAGVTPYILNGTGSFTAGSGAFINLTGAAFSVPEPTTFTVIASVGAMLISRRRAGR